MSVFGTEKSIGTDSNLAYQYAPRVLMTQADFLREHDVNAHAINSIKYWSNALMKDKEGKVVAKIRSSCHCFQERILVKRLVTLTGNNVDSQEVKDQRCSTSSERLGTHNNRDLHLSGIKADGKTGSVSIWMEGGFEETCSPQGRLVRKEILVRDVTM